MPVMHPIGARGRIVLIAAVNLVALGSLTAPAVAGLALAVDRMVPAEQRTVALAAIVTTGAIAALVANPLFGFLSDRTRSRFGRRRPWLLGGAIAGALAAGALTMATSLGLLTVTWVAMQLAYNAMLAGAAALLAESVTDEQRASASGLFAASSFAGTVPALALTALFPAQIGAVTLVLPLLAVVVTAVCCLMVPESAGAAPRASASLRHARTSGFIAIWVQRFVQQLAFTLLASFTLFFAMDRFARGAEGAASLAALTTLGGGASVVLGAATVGWWASRRGDYLPFLIATPCGLAVAGVIRAFSVDAPLLLLSSVLGGLAMGGFYAVNLALALRTVPPQSAGGPLGVLNMAETLPQVIGPPIATLLLTAGPADPLSGAADNYLVLYLVASAAALTALALTPLLRTVARRPLVAAAVAGPARE